MASARGREQSLARFLFNRQVMAVKALPKSIDKLVAAEIQRQDRYIQRRTDPIEQERGEFLHDVLKAVQTQGARSFGIVWNPHIPFAEGPSIEPFAHIFDRFVHGCWTVRVMNDIDGLGNPGWLFERG